MQAPQWLPVLHILILSTGYRSCLSAKVSGQLCLDGSVKKACDESDHSFLLQQGHTIRGSRKAATAVRHSFFQVADGEVKADEQVKTDGSAAPTSSYWAFANPLALGLGLGLLLIGPDHLGTLMALSTLTTGFASFNVGFAWGVGHSVGMILIMPLFFLMKKLSTKTWNVSVDSWEYYGDYFVGASMILISFYFVLYEHHYIEQKDDGTFDMKTCGCCAQVESDIDKSDNESQDLRNICGKYGAKSKSTYAQPGEVTSRKLSNKDDQARSAWSRLWRPMFSARDWQGAIVGILQGLCCPTGLMGIGFMGKIGSNSSLPALFAFALVFVFTSGLGSGAITFGWGMMSSRGLASCISPRMMYLASCVVTGLLGLIWVVANAAGVLHHINYAEKLHLGMESLQRFE